MKPVDVIKNTLVDYDAEAPGVMSSAILSALSSAGFAIVPREATEAMIDAGDECRLAYDERNPASSEAIYRAMIAAGEG